MAARKTGYVFHGSGTPKRAEQVKTLVDAGCVEKELFIDAAPSRSDRETLIEVGIEPGDTIILAVPSVIGSGAKDTASAVARICEAGALIQVVGFEARAYSTDADIANFAKEAVADSRKINATNMLARRSRAGPKGKLDALTPDQWATTKWLWFHEKAKQQVAVDYVNECCGVKATRVNIAQRIAREMKAKQMEQSDG